MQTSPNDTKRWMPVCRGAVALTAALAPVPWLWRLVVDLGAASAAEVPVRADEALTGAVAAGALVALGWLVLGLLLGLAALVPGAVGRRAARVAEVATPALARRLVGGLLGVGLAAGLAPGAAVAAPQRVLVTAPAPLPDPGFDPLPDPGWGSPTTASSAPSATPTTSASPTATETGTAPATTPWVAPPPLVRAQPDVRVLSPSPRPGADNGDGDESGGQVVVHRGDSLWSIAARHLGRQASDAEIARSWPAWFDANREVIGDDPDLLRPGQLLRPPEGVGS